MKKLKIIALVALAFGLMSCENDSDPVPVFDLPDYRLVLTFRNDSVINLQKIPEVEYSRIPGMNGISYQESGEGDDTIISFHISYYNPIDFPIFLQGSNDGKETWKTLHTIGVYNMYDPGRKIFVDDLNWIN